MFPCLPPNELLDLLVGEFVEVVRPAKMQSYRLADAIRPVVENRLRECRLSGAEVAAEVTRVSEAAAASEERLIDMIAGAVEPGDAAGFVRWSVGDGAFARTQVFRHVANLFRWRYGETEALRLQEVFSNPENDRKFFICVEYGRDMTGKLQVRRLWLQQRAPVNEEGDRGQGSEEEFDPEWA